MCDCSSNNKAGLGEVPQVGINSDEYFNWDSESRLTYVDACIVDQIKALWAAGIWTRGCCCGHNGAWIPLQWEGPNVIISESGDPEKALEVLREADPNRTWNVLQWQLVNTSAK